jgi:hypothetical protein
MGNAEDSVESFLKRHPKLVESGVTLDDFNFKSPKRLADAVATTAAATTAAAAGAGAGVGAASPSSSAAAARVSSGGSRKRKAAHPSPAPGSKQERRDKEDWRVRAHARRIRGHRLGGAVSRSYLVSCWAVG